jgi:hypothetical protein
MSLVLLTLAVGLISGIAAVLLRLLGGWRGAWDSRWSWPFVWITLIPVLTVPSTWIALGGVIDSGACELVEPSGGSRLGNLWGCPNEWVIAAHLFGSLNLVAFAWLLVPLARWAGAIAGGIGALRFGLPIAYYSTQQTVLVGDFFVGVHDYPLWPLQLVLWAAPAALLLLVGAAGLTAFVRSRRVW